LTDLGVDVIQPRSVSQNWTPVLLSATGSCRRLATCRFYSFCC